MSTRYEIRHDRIAGAVFDRAGAKLRDRRRVKALVEDKLRRSQGRDAEVTERLNALETGEDRTAKTYQATVSALEKVQKGTGFFGLAGRFMGWAIGLVLGNRHRYVRFMNRSFLLSPEELLLVEQYGKDITWDDKAATREFVDDSYANLRVRRVVNNVLGIAGAVLILVAIIFYANTRIQADELRIGQAMISTVMAETYLKDNNVPGAYIMIKEADRLSPDCCDEPLTRILMQSHYGEFDLDRGMRHEGDLLLSMRNVNYQLGLYLYRFSDNSSTLLTKTPLAVNGRVPPFGFTPSEPRTPWWINGDGRTLTVGSIYKSRFDEWESRGFIFGRLGLAAGAGPTYNLRISELVDHTWSGDGHRLGIIYRDSATTQDLVNLETFHYDPNVAPSRDSSHRVQLRADNPWILPYGEEGFLVCDFNRTDGLLKGYVVERDQVRKVFQREDIVTLDDESWRFEDNYEASSWGSVLRFPNVHLFVVNGSEPYVFVLYLPESPEAEGVRPRVYLDIEQAIPRVITFRRWEGEGWIYELTSDGPNGVEYDLTQNTPPIILQWMREKYGSYPALPVGSRILYVDDTLAAAQLNGELFLYNVTGDTPIRRESVQAPSDLTWAAEEIDGKLMFFTLARIRVPSTRKTTTPDSVTLYHEVDGEIIPHTVPGGFMAKDSVLFPVQYYYSPGRAPISLYTLNLLESRPYYALDDGYFFVASQVRYFGRSYRLLRLPPRGQSLADMFATTPYFNDDRPYHYLLNFDD